MSLRTIRISGMEPQAVALLAWLRKPELEMKRKLVRMLASMGALAVAAAGYATLGEAEAVRPGCNSIAPYCSDECSCGPMRCDADCDKGCPDWLREAGHDGQLTVWCQDILP